VAGKIIKCLQFLTWYPKFDYFNAQISSSIPSLLTTQNSVLTLQCFRISHEEKNSVKKNPYNYNSCILRDEEE